MECQSRAPIGLVLEGTDQVHLCLFKVRAPWWPTWGHRKDTQMDQGWPEQASQGEGEGSGTEARKGARAGAGD